jgi:hypothetical protein
LHPRQPPHPPPPRRQRRPRLGIRAKPTIGYWQNKAWKADDPVSIALEATKAAREAQRFVGAPPEQLIRLPKDAKDEAGWNSVWNRLGKPADPKGYDFTDVKFADGSAIKDSLADTIRKTAFENNIPKDAAAAFARSLVKHMDSEDTTEAGEVKAKYDASLQRLKETWGTNGNINLVTAAEGARKLGISPELQQKVMETLGADVAAEMFRKAGQGLSEDKLVEGNKNAPATVDAARARRTELMQDKDWVTRYRKGGVAEKREMHNLNQIITNVVDSAA